MINFTREIIFLHEVREFTSNIILTFFEYWGQYVCFSRH